MDISTFGAILLHVRDPFLALQNVLLLTKETVIITSSHRDLPTRVFNVLRLPVLPYEILDRLHIYGWLRGLLTPPQMRFIPTPRGPGSAGKWWDTSPESLRLMIALLGFGFERVSISYHWQKYRNRKARLYTLVGHRTQDY